jgi:NAD(P)-dependent dehydrogenase (short-subunit alcohol dehydrogenase family)
VTKIFVITGATSGIGRAAALALAQSDAALVLVGRNSRRGSEVVERIKNKSPSARAHFIETDLSTQKDVRQLAMAIRREFNHVDVLINNAGARFDTYGATEDGFERTFATNHLGHFLLTSLLLEHLRAAPSARIITVSSAAHRAANMDGTWSYQEHEYDRRQAYAKSKLANIVFAFELARRLKETRIVSNAVDPGVVSTNFARNNGLLAWAKHTISHGLRGELVSAARAASTIVYLAASAEVAGVTGALFRERQVIEPSPAAHDRALAEALWIQSIALTGLDAPGTFGGVDKVCRLPASALNHPYDYSQRSQPAA